MIWQLGTIIKIKKKIGKIKIKNIRQIKTKNKIALPNVYLKKIYYRRN